MGRVFSPPGGWTATLLLVALGGAAPGAETPSTEELVRQLGSPDFARREQAVSLLRKRGPAVLPALQMALESRDPEVRRRAGALARVLKASAALRPKRVTFGEDVRHLAAAVQAIRRQTDYPLVLDPKVKADEIPWAQPLQKVPFWEAVATIELRTGLVVRLDPLDEGIRLEPGKRRSPFTVVNGPFRLEVTGFHEDRDIDFTLPGPDRYLGRHDHLLTLSVTILAEPRFALLGVEPGEVERAMDDTGKPLEQAKAPSDEEKGVVRTKELLRKRYEHHARVVLKRTAEGGRTVQALHAAIPALVVAERKPVVVSEDLFKAQGLKCQSGGDTLELTDVFRPERGGVYLRFNVPPPTPGLTPYWLDRVSVQDAMGNRFEHNSSGHGHSGGQHYFSLVYPASSKTTVGPPKRLVVEDWVILRHAITFVLKDIPLP